MRPDSRAGPKVWKPADLCRQLRDLGLRAGDIALVRVDFGKLGRLASPGDQTLIHALLEAIGADGTLLAITHSPAQWLFRRNREYVFHPDTAPCTTGRFAEAVTRWPGALRSGHPTCSMTGIGPRSRDLLRDHDHRSTCCAPLRKLIDANAWMISLGCAFTSPGFSSIHFAYEELGLARQSFLSGLLGCYHRTASGVRWFSQRDISGCSHGFHKFYPLYRERGLLRTGTIGLGEAFAIRAPDAYAVECAAVKADPTFGLCDDLRCLSCRGTRLFNLRDMPGYWLAHALPRVLRQLVRMPRRAA